MRAYAFRLATVTRIRRLEERVAREALLVAVRDRRRALERAGAATDALREYPANAERLTMRDVTWRQEQAARLAEEQRGAEALAGEAEVIRLAARGRWDATAKRAGVLDRLDERARSRWLEAWRLEEVAELDDLATSRHGRAS